MNNRNKRVRNHNHSLQAQRSRVRQVLHLIHNNRIRKSKIKTREKNAPIDIYNW